MVKRLLETIHEKSGTIARGARNTGKFEAGTSALDVAREFHPDVILSDIGLPGIDGYQVAQWLRREPACRGALLVAVTGYGQREDETKAREAGFDYHLTKPLDLARLDTILTTLGTTDPAASSSPEAALP